MEIAETLGVHRAFRTTPPSLRFLGRHVYLATMVTLISAMQLGTTPSRLARLSVVAGIAIPISERCFAGCTRRTKRPMPRAYAAACSQSPGSGTGKPIKLRD
jgi:hypothetical protein